MKKANHDKIILRVSLFFMILIHIAIIINTVFISVSMRKTSYDENIRYENSVLSSFSKELDSINSTAFSLLMQLYNSSTVRELTTYKNLSDTQLLALKSQLSDYYFPEPYTYNYYLINSSLERVCTNQQLFSFDSFFDKEMLSFLEENPKPQLQTPFFRKNVSVTGDNSTYDFFTFIQYDNYYDTNPDSYIVVNISVSRIDSAMQNYCLENEQMLLFEKDGTPILECSSGFEIDSKDMQDIFALSSEERTVSVKIDGKSYIAISMPIEQDSLLAVRLIPSQSVYQKSNFVTLIILLIGLFSLGATTTVYYILRNRLLSPIHQIIDDYDNLKYKSSKFLKASAIRMLQNPLLGTDDEATRDLLEQLQISDSYDSDIVLCICRFDRYAELCSEYDTRYRSALLFAISNVAQDLFENICRVQGFAVDEKTEMLLLDRFGDTPPAHGELAAVLRQLQSFTVQKLGFSFSAAVSEPFKAMYVQESYSKTFLALEQRFITGHSCIIEDSAEESDEYAPLFTTGNTVFEQLKLRNYEKAFSIIFTAIEKHISSYQSAYRFNSYMNFIVTDFCFEMMRGNEDIYWQALNEEFRRKTEASETVFEVLDAYKWLKEQLISYENETAGNSDYLSVSEQIKDIINNEYPDFNLSLQSISDNFPLSPVYIGRIFRKCNGCSVADYINTVRLDHVVHLLTTTEMLVQDIAAECGFENTTYMYTLFKKRYGLTPSQYKKTHSS